jgi:hypothetical protein
LTQNSEFDHREQSEVLFTTTNPDGSFVIPSVPYGVYNLVVSKEGWGYRYLYNITLNSKELDVTQFVDNNGELQLYPEMVVSGLVVDTIVIEDWHHLVLADDTTFSPQSSLLIGPNGIIRIEPGRRLEILGSLTATGSEGNMFVITVNHGINRLESKANESQEFLIVSIDSSSTIYGSTISWGRFGPSSTALGFQYTEEASISYCRFESSSECVSASYSDSISVERSLFIGDTLNNGLKFFMVNAGNLSENMFVNNRSGILLEELCSQTIEDNVFVANEYGVEMFNCAPTVAHNYFRKNEYGIRLTGLVSPTVEYNYIDGETCIIIGFNGYYGNANPNIHYNNMIAKKNYIYLWAANIIDIQAQNNYYYTIDTEEIEKKIYDKYDYPSHHQSQVASVVFTPFLRYRVQGAGPRM